MKRREIVTLIGGAIAWPLAATAQQSGQTRRVGILLGLAESDPEAQTIVAAFGQGLRISAGPRVATVAVILNPDNASNIASFQAIEASATSHRQVTGFNMPPLVAP